MGLGDALTGASPAVPLLAAVVLALVVVTGLGLRARARDRARLHAERERAAGLGWRFAGLLAAGRDGLVLHSSAGRILQLNDAAARLLDVDAGDMIGRDLTDLPVTWLSEAGEPFAPRAVFAGAPSSGTSHPATDDALGAPSAVAVDSSLVVCVAPRSGGQVRWVQVRTRTVPALDGGREMLTSMADLTGTREFGAAHARSEGQMRAAMENAPIGMVVADPRWRLKQVNRAFAEMLGVDGQSLLGTDLSELSHPEDRAAEREHVQRLLAGEADRFSYEKRYVRADGQAIWTVLDVALVRTADGTPDHFVAQVRDATEARVQSERLAHRAMHDPLTGLANRSLMQEVLQAAVEQPDAAGRVGVLVLDLDEFKQVNDRYGHPVGDEVLVHVAGVIRSATGGRGTASRLGGDEFVIVLQDSDAGRTAYDVASAIHRGLHAPVRVQRRELPVRASIGVAVADEVLLAGGAMAVLAAADAALYKAKAGGRGRTEVYEPSMQVTGSSRHGVAAEIGRAIDAGELVLHYQPVVHLGTGAVVGHEALVRWQHPERGLLLPGSFLSTAEETGLGVLLGTTVLDQAIEHLARTAGSDRWVSMNVSADQLSDGAFTTRVRSEIAAGRVPAGRLVVELTEGSLVDSGTRVRHQLTELRSAGVAVLLDDFGAGASPLSYLRDLPISGVKLDMSFAAGIPEDPSAARVNRALAALAREMALTTIATGIETAEQATHMRDAGWSQGQGWLFGAGQAEPVAGLPLAAGRA